MGRSYREHRQPENHMHVCAGMHTGTQSETCPLRLANPCRPVHTEKKTCIYMHAQKHTCMYAHAHAHARSHRHTYRHTLRTHTTIHTCMHAQTCMHTRTHTCTNALAHTNTHTHTCTCTHSYTHRDNLAALTSSLFLIPFPGLSTYQKASTCGDWLTWKWTRRGRLGSWLLCLAGSS